jgi:hypothetical protein
MTVHRANRIDIVCDLCTSGLLKIRSRRRAHHHDVGKASANRAVAKTNVALRKRVVDV